MNTQQIQSILQNDLMTKGLFQAVFPTYQLPSSYDGMYMINTDKHDEPGAHWVVVYNKEYFDPFSVPPQDKWLLNFLGQNVITTVCLYNNY